MKPKILLRVAAILMLLHTLGHTMGALGWKNAPNDAIRGVISGMQKNHFVFMGRSASLADFYEGYGLSMIGVLLLVSITLWLLSGDSNNPLSRKLQPLFALFLLCLAIIEYVYFFPFAAAFTLLAGLCTGAAVGSAASYRERSQ